MDETVLWQLSYGMYAIGAKHGEEDKGCIVNTVVQIKAENPIIAVSMNKDNYTYEVIRESGQFAVSILGEEVDNNVIAELGFASGRTKEKFKLFAAGHTKEGLPIVEQGAVGYLTCKVLQMVDAETHAVILARVVDAQKGDAKTPMTYAYYHAVRKGKAPKNAPTYRKEATAATEKKTCVCTVCGYVYEGSLDSMPEDYQCPICKNGKSFFKEQ